MVTLKNVDALYDIAPKETHAFIDYTVSWCARNNISINILKSKSVNIDGSPCAGCFSSNDRKLSVAIKKPFNDWFMIYIHEFCHATQYIDNPKKFSADDDSASGIFDWLDGKKVNIKFLKNEALSTMRLEADCEARVLKLVKRFKLQKLIKPGDYAQKANAYVQFYQHVIENRKWYKIGRQPYMLPEVWKLFPKKVYIGKLRLNKKQREAYHMCCEE